jgi:hypothetical protein
MNPELLEATFRTWMLNGIPARQILTALHNTCSHGAILEECGFEVPEKQLCKLFDGFDKSIKALKKIENV